MLDVNPQQLVPLQQFDAVASGAALPYSAARLGCCDLICFGRRKHETPAEAPAFLVERLKRSPDRVWSAGQLEPCGEVSKAMPLRLIVVELRWGLGAWLRLAFGSANCNRHSRTCMGLSELFVVVCEPLSRHSTPA